MEYLFSILEEQYLLLWGEGRAITEETPLWQVIKYYARVQLICTLIDVLELGTRLFGEE